MNFIKQFFVQNKQEQQEQEDHPPSYENACESFNTNDKVILINKKSLKDARDSIINYKHQVILQEIKSSIIDTIKRYKIIRYIIGIIVKESFEERIKVFSLNKNIMEYYDFNREFCRSACIFVIVKNEKEKSDLINFLSNNDFIKTYSIIDKNKPLIKFYYNIRIIKNDPLFKDISSVICESYPLFFNYESLYKNNELLLLEAYNQNVDHELIAQLKKMIYEESQAGKDTITWEIAELEFYFEFFKFNQTFGDLNLSINGKNIDVSW